MAERKPPHAPRGFAIRVVHERGTRVTNPLRAVFWGFSFRRYVCFDALKMAHSIKKYEMYKIFQPRSKGFCEMLSKRFLILPVDAQSCEYNGGLKISRYSLPEIKRQCVVGRLVTLLSEKPDIMLQFRFFMAWKLPFVEVSIFYPVLPIFRPKTVIFMIETCLRKKHTWKNQNWTII